MKFFTDQTESSDKIRERLELVLEGTHLGMWDWNPQTNEVVFDQLWAEMLGLLEDELSQTLDDWSSREHPDDIDSCFSDIQAHLSGETPFYENTHRMMHKDGGWRYILDRGKVVEWDENGQPIRFTGTHTDVTALKKAEEEAQRALTARNQFFTQVSHEIRTPMHGIMAAVDILSRRASDEETLKLMGIVKDSGELLLTLLNDLLDLSKISSGKLHLALATFPVIPLLERIIELFKLKADIKGIDFELVNNCETSAENLWISTDKSRLSQIISNLVSNAVKFTEEGYVRAVLSEKDGLLYLTIEDTGPGMEVVDEMFIPYATQADKEELGIRGTGLGLSIVKSLCEQMNMTLEASSSIGKGTRFELALGSVDFDVAHRPKVSVAETLIVSDDCGSCLIVDDNRINLLVAEDIIGDFFSCIDTATDGRQALKKVMAGEGGFDYIFMDLNMPIMNGEEAVRQIRHLPLEKQPIIIAQTADANTETIEHLKEKGFDGVILKPYEQKDVKLLLAERH